MVLEMKRALEDLKSGDSQGYRKIFDATYEDVYCRSLLIIQKEETVLGFMKAFFSELFEKLDEADDAESQEKWLWQKYYDQMRKQYHKLLAEQGKNAQPAGRVRTLAEIPSSLPLLHRIMLTMYYKDDFTVDEISGTFHLEEGKVQGEIDKLEKLLPVLCKGQPDSVSRYLGSWNALLLGASKQILSTGSDEWVDRLYDEIAADADIVPVPVQEKKDDFEYFVADVELSDVKGKKGKAELVDDQPEDDEEEPEDDDDEDEDEYEDDDEDDEDEDEDDEDDDRYDWDLEDDGKKMVILGIVLALIIVAVIGVLVFKILGKGDNESKEPTQIETTADEDNDAELIIRGDGPDEDAEEEEESQEEEPQEEEPQEEEPAEPETLTMKVSASSVNVRSEANTNCDVLTTVKSGEQVEVLGDPSEEWVQIRCIEQDSQEGYVKSEFLAAVE